MFYNQYKNSSHPFPFSIEGEGGGWAGAGSGQPPFLLKIDKLFTGQETITNIIMKSMSRGLSIKDICIVGGGGGGRVAKSEQGQAH